MSSTTLNERLQEAILERFGEQITRGQPIQVRYAERLARAIVSEQPFAVLLEYAHETAREEARELVEYMVATAKQEREYQEWKAEVARCLADPEFSDAPRTAPWREAFHVFKDAPRLAVRDWAILNKCNPLPWYRAEREAMETIEPLAE